MADGNDQHQGFFGLRLAEDDDENWLQFTFGRSLDKLKEWGKKNISSGEDRRSQNYEKAALVDDVGKNVIPELTIMRELLSRVLDSGLALSELAISSSAIKGIFSQIIARVEVVDPIRENCPIVFEEGKFRVHGITADRLAKIGREHRRLLRMDRGFDLLPSSVLLTIVATFDSLTADVVRTMLALKPERFSQSGKTVPVFDLLAMDSFEDLKSKLIDDEVYQFSRGSHEDQVKDIEKWFNVKVGESWKRWPDFIEVFERRNLIAHGEKKFTKRYVSICKSHNHKGSENLIDQEILITPQYLNQSLDVLVEFAILLVFSIWRKQLPNEENSAFDELNAACYRMITEARYRVPVRVLEYALSLKNVRITESTRLMLTVNLASAHRHRSNKDLSDKVLDSVDWSAVSDNFSICVASLKDELSEVLRMMPAVAASRTVTKEDFRTWPVFSFVRDKKEFADKFEEIFGEVLFDPQAESTMVETEESLKVIVSDQDATMH